jgi:hypothetical protein
MLGWNEGYFRKNAFRTVVGSGAVHDHYSVIYIEYAFFLNYDYDGVFSHILIEWNNISDLTPFFLPNQNKKQGRIREGRLVKRQ